MTRELRRLLKRATAAEVLQLRPGDVIVIRVPDTTTETDAARLREALSGRLPAEFVILPRAIGVGVLRSLSGDGA